MHWGRYLAPTSHTEAPSHILCAALILFLRVVACPRDAHGYLSGNQYPCGDGDLEPYRPQSAENGTAPHHLQPVPDPFEPQRHQEQRGAGLADLSVQKVFSSQRSISTLHCANRFRDRFHSRAVAAGNQRSARGAVQCIDCCRSALSSDTLSERQLCDYGICRTRLPFWRR